MDQENFYRDNYERYVQDLLQDDRLKKVINIFNNIKAHKILDIGCGNGNFSIYLKEISGAEEVYGIEISDEGIGLANKRGVKTFKVDVSRDVFPFEDNYFDLIFCGEIIEHLYDTDHFLDEVYRVCKAEGKIIITTPNLAAWYNRISLFLGFQPYWSSVSLRHNIGKPFKTEWNDPSGGGHIRLFTYNALCDLLCIHKFVISKKMGSYVDGPIPFNILDRILSVFPSLSSRIIILAQVNKGD